MLLSKRVQEMVIEIGGIIEGDVDFIDVDGYVIASTIDQHRGQYHILGKELVDQHLDEMYVPPEKATEMIFSGLYLSVHCGMESAGVIGISGSQEYIYKYGNIVKKMTEILLRELDEDRRKKELVRMREIFLEAWILKDGDEIEEGQIERGLAMGIDITQAYRVMVVGFSEGQVSMDSGTLQKKQEQLEKLRNSVFPDSIVLRHVGREIILLGQRGDKEMLQAAEYFQSSAKRLYSLEISIGIDGDSDNMHVAYLQADKAWKSTRLYTNQICLYNNLALELFVIGIPDKIKEDYIRKIFPECSYEELDAWMELLKVYFSVDGSIQKGAELLHMHKNTLQNKIKKLEKITSCDVRKPNYASLLYMALVFYIEQRPRFALMGSKKQK